MENSGACMAMLLVIAALMGVIGYGDGSRILKEDGGDEEILAPAPPGTTITFFMHDIVGGPNPTAKPISGGGFQNGPLPLLQPNLNSYSNVNGPLPFSQNPSVPVLPLSAAGPFPLNRPLVAPQNGALPLPYPLNPSIPNNYNNNANAGPFPSFPFSVIVIDDPLTEGPDHSSPLLGKGQGYYMPTGQGEDATTLLLSFTATFEDSTQYKGCTIDFSGIDNIALPQREIAVVGGTGKFQNAEGHAIIETVSNVALETVLKFTVNLTY